MQALQKRRERWEHYNEKRLELVIDAGQLLLQKQIRVTLQLLSFLLFLAYRGGQHLLRVSRVLWVYPKDLDQRLRAAEQQRLELTSVANRWLK